MESLSTMLVQAEKQLTLTKSALEDSSTARNELKALVTELEKKNDVLERTLQLAALMVENVVLRGEKAALAELAERGFGDKGKKPAARKR